jgi:hypothetical protein
VKTTRREEFHYEFVVPSCGQLLARNLFDFRLGIEHNKAPLDPDLSCQARESLLETPEQELSWLLLPTAAKMFSPDARLPSHGHSLRPKRSRRAGSDDSIKLPRAKRRRSALRKDTFEPLSDLSPNEVAVRANGDITMNGHAPGDKPDQDDTFHVQKELTLRAAKKADKRSERGSGTTTLVGVFPDNVWRTWRV